MWWIGLIMNYQRIIQNVTKFYVKLWYKPNKSLFPILGWGQDRCTEEELADSCAELFKRWRVRLVEF